MYEIFHSIHSRDELTTNVEDKLNPFGKLIHGEWWGNSHQEDPRRTVEGFWGGLCGNCLKYFPLLNSVVFLKYVFVGFIFSHYKPPC